MHYIYLFRSAGYSSSKSKTSSAASLADVNFVDLFETATPVYDMSKVLNIDDFSSSRGETGGVPHLIIFNGMHPSYAPQLWGSVPLHERHGHQLVVFAALSNQTKRQLSGEEEMTPAVKLLKEVRNNRRFSCYNSFKFVLLKNVFFHL
jgi:hypothetical protein